MNEAEYGKTGREGLDTFDAGKVSTCTAIALIYRMNELFVKRTLIGGHTTFVGPLQKEV